MKKNLSLLLLIATCVLLASAADGTPAISGDSIYNLKSQWTNEHGESVFLSQFRGRPLIAAMIYTNCVAACPLIVLDMQKIESALPGAAREKIQLVLFTFDSKKDTPDKLLSYAKAHSLNLKHWTLLSGNALDTRKIAMLLGVGYERLPNGDYSHSNVITLIDSEGIIRHRQVGLSQDPSEFVKAVLGLPSK